MWYLRSPVYRTEGMPEKTTNFKVGQNSRFWKRDKIADFDNEIKRGILKWDKNDDLYKYNSLVFAKKVVQDKSVLA